MCESLRVWYSSPFWSPPRQRPFLPSVHPEYRPLMIQPHLQAGWWRLQPLWVKYFLPRRWWCAWYDPSDNNSHLCQYSPNHRSWTSPVRRFWRFLPVCASNREWRQDLLTRFHRFDRRPHPRRCPDRQFWLQDPAEGIQWTPLFVYPWVDLKNSCPFLSCPRVQPVACQRFHIRV